MNLRSASVKQAIGASLLHRLRMSVLGVSVFLIAVISISHALSEVVINSTPSVKAHVLRKAPDRKIVKGDYVMVPISSAYLPRGYDTLTKHVLCAEGDVLSFKRGAFYCNGKYLHRPKMQSISGAPLTRFAWEEGIIPKGLVYAGSSHPDGFDSRYLGLFRLEDLTRLEPIL